MTAERYQRIKQVFEQASDMPIVERAPFLESTCRGDPQLLREVESLLAADGQQSGVLGRGVAELAPGFFAELSATLNGSVGPYRLLQEVGAGGMGVVYEAMRDDDQYRQRVAIKLVKRGMDTDAVLRRFRHERQILASLEHPNIARLLDGGVAENGQPYFVMEYIQGQPIDQYCAERKLTVTERLALFQNVCRAVHHAHQNLVVHRDLKPGNVLVTADGSVKLLDFGIAKLLTENADSVNLTMTGLRVMTPEYASPEQLRGAAITTASDIYSLGVVLYELLTGQKPFPIGTGTLAELERMICESEPPRPSAIIVPDNNRSGETHPANLRLLKGDLDNIILKAMRKEPERRYSSAQQLADDLVHYIERRPVIARKDTLGYRVGKFVGRHKAGVAAAALVMAMLAAGVVAVGWEAKVAREEKARAERRFNDVRKLAGSFLFEFHDAIQSLAGSTPARKLVVSKALQYLDSLAKESGGDPSLQLELASAYEKVGTIQWAWGFANLGDRAGAMASQQKALAIRKAILDGDAANKVAKAGLGTSYLLVGDLEAASDLQRAVADYRRSLRIRQELVAANPQDRVARRNLAASYGQLGNVLGNPQIPNLGDTAGALDNYRKMRELFEKLAAEQPHDAYAHWTLATGYQRLANMKEAQSDFVGALELHRKELGIYADVVQQQPDDSRARRALAVAYENVGATLAALGNASAALEYYAQALSRRETLARADPENALMHGDIMGSLQLMGAAYAKTGRQSDAKRFTVRLLAAEKAWAERPNATADDWNEYARALLTCDPPHLRKPALALPAARRAAEMSAGRDAAILDTLALALFSSGDRALAIKAERNAIAVAGESTGLRKDFESALLRYEQDDAR